MKRPYDYELIPPSAEKSPRAGLTYRRYDGDFPWTPLADAMKPSAKGQTPTPDPSAGPKDRPFALLFTGFLNAPADGTYTLSLATETGALLRVHDAIVIDADFGYPAGKEITETIRLKAGRHPFRLYYLHRTGRDAQLTLRWSGPGFAMQPIPATAFLR